MNNITEVTRRDILDTIKSGFEKEASIWDILDNQSTHKVYMPYYGRLNVGDFLARVYDFDNMKPFDSRYSSSSKAINLHIEWGDIEDDFIFDDDRFELTNGTTDEPLLKFLCEMLHPLVRIEDECWKEYLTVFNELLQPDGYELYSVKQISGRDVYGYRELNHVEISRANSTENVGLVYIGSGSYADVYKYYDAFYRRTFAVKRAKENIDSKALKRFKKEFEEMSKLNSQFVVEVYSYNDEKNEYIMEYMDETLKAYIDRNYESLNKTQKATICFKILKAFKELHRNRVLHRDISPQNVLVKKYMEGVVFKVADFGFIKTPESDLTTTNTSVRGSLNDPSLATTGFKNYSIVHEIYALTRLMVFILTGSLDHATIGDDNIHKLLDNGTNPVVDKRYKSIDELKDAVLECVKSME